LATRTDYITPNRASFLHFSPLFGEWIANDDNRKFTEIYTVQRLQSSYVAKDSQLCISTIQRMYSILKGEEIDSALEDINPAEQLTKPKTPMPVVYNPKVPIEFFDFIFIDECHRSIYNIWQQVLDYFDSFLIGLTATPDNRTYGFFKKNVVSHYDHEKAVADNVNVGNEIYLIETAITQAGAKIKADQLIEKREKLTRKKRWEQQDEDETYSASQLDNSIVNPDQIRTIIETFKENLPLIFPNRKEVPKTLIFAKTDSHADDIINTVREEFAEGNAFCKKITYKTEEDPKSTLADFRNAYYPRIAVTVDMIATGTDVKPLECLLFMRDVRSRNYFEQMKGRGTRTLDHDELKKVTPSALTAKTHYVIVDAVGVTKSLKTASQPLITKPTVPLKDLAMGVMMGANDTDTISSLAGRLARLNQQLSPAEKDKLKKLSGGFELSTLINNLFNAIDADNIEQKACELAGLTIGSELEDAQREQAQVQFLLTDVTASLYAKSHGSGMVHVTKGKFESTEIVLPPLPEQHRIVAKIEALFSELDKGIECFKTAREQLKIYRQTLLKHAFSGKLTAQWRAENEDKLETVEALLQRIQTERERRYQQQLKDWEAADKQFSKPKTPKTLPPLSAEELAELPELPDGWAWTRLGNTNVEVSDGPFGSNLKSSDYVDSGVRVVRLENIGALEFIEGKESYVTEGKYDLLKRHTVSAGDIIFSSFITENIRVALLPPSVTKAINKADCFYVRFSGETLSNVFVVTFLSTRHVYKQLEALVHGVGRPRINTTQLKDVVVPVCSAAEQKVIIAEIESRLSKVDQLDQTLTTAQQAEALRQSILMKAFSGQLVPQDPNDESASVLLERVQAEKATLAIHSPKSGEKCKKEALFGVI
jgi:restriction endonuclease S subunit